MKRIGLLSDTHGYLDDKIFSYFSECDEIYHAGDFGNIKVVKSLSDFKPLKGVYGNIDGQEIRKLYPKNQRFFCEDVDIFITHIGGYPGHYNPDIKSLIDENPPNLFISGHSHILKVIWDKKYNLLHINPGAAGKEGWHQTRTVVRFVIDGKEIKNLEVIELGKR